MQRVESPEVLRADIRLGTRMPLHASASGKALLAAMSDAEIDRELPELRLPGSARRTLRERDALLAELRLGRERGTRGRRRSCVGWYRGGGRSCLRRGGRVLAALSIAGPIARFDEEAWAGLLLPVASQMSQLSAIGDGPAVVARMATRRWLAGAAPRPWARGRTGDAGVARPITEIEGVCGRRSAR